MLPAWSMWISGSPTSRWGSDGTLADQVMPPVPFDLNLVAPSAPGRARTAAATATHANALIVVRRRAGNFIERPPQEGSQGQVALRAPSTHGAPTPAPTLEVASGYADVGSVNE